MPEKIRKWQLFGQYQSISSCKPVFAEIVIKLKEGMLSSMTYSSTLNKNKRWKLLHFLFSLKNQAYYLYILHTFNPGAFFLEGILLSFFNPKALAKRFPWVHGDILLKKQQHNHRPNKIKGGKASKKASFFLFPSCCWEATLFTPSKPLPKHVPFRAPCFWPYKLLSLKQFKYCKTNCFERGSLS